MFSRWRVCTIAGSGKIFGDLDCVCHLFAESQCVLDQKVGLFFPPAAVESEIQVKLYRIYAGESVHELAWTIEYATGLGIVGRGRCHQEYIGSFADGLQSQIVS